MRQRIRKNVPCGDINGLLEQIMLENNEASVDRCGVAQDLLPVGKHLTDSCGTTVDVEVCVVSH